MVSGLRSSGFKLIAHRDVYGPNPRNGIEDPEVIAYCGRVRNKLVLLTADKDLEFTYAPEIRKAGIAIFVVSNNREGPDIWLPRLLSARLDMERELCRRAKPFAARINAEGRVSQVRRYFKKKDKVWHIRPQDHLVPKPIPVSGHLFSSVPAQPSEQSAPDA
jgi:hypothetical protein